MNDRELRVRIQKAPADYRSRGGSDEIAQCLRAVSADRKVYVRAHRVDQNVEDRPAGSADSFDRPSGVAAHVFVADALAEDCDERLDGFRSSRSGLSQCIGSVPWHARVIVV